MLTWGLENCLNFFSRTLSTVMLSCLPCDKCTYCNSPKCLKVKLSPKRNLGFFCECIWVKPSCKSMITMKEAFLRFTVFLFSGQTHFQWECYGHFYDSIKISIFKTVRRLDTTWIFAHSITRLSLYTWTPALRTLFVNIVCVHRVY